MKIIRRLLLVNQPALDKLYSHLIHFYENHLNCLKICRKDLKKQEGCGVVAHERLTEPHVRMEWLLPKRNSLSDLLVFLDPYGRNSLVSKLSRKIINYSQVVIKNNSKLSNEKLVILIYEIIIFISENGDRRILNGHFTLVLERQKSTLFSYIIFIE